MSKQEEYVTKIPLALQTYFWRITTPYMNPRLSKQCESSSVTLERLLVQNMQHGLSPGITAAVSTVPRWLYLKASLPYVIHCCATIVKNFDKGFTNYESKLLYTMHWLLLDAASECNLPPEESLFSLSCIQLFVYLFTPLLNKIEPKHFDSLKLHHGLKIWNALWEYSQPQILSMCTPVKQRIDSKQTDGYFQSSQDSVYYGMEPGDSHEGQDDDAMANLSATYFDVAVLQCLSNSRWPVRGVLWALHYIQRRLDKILENHQQARGSDKSRSMSMPLPTIEISVEGSSSKTSDDPALPDDEELFRPKSRITEETLLKNKRPKTESYNRKSSGHRKKQEHDPSTIVSSIAHSASNELLKVTQDVLADIEEEDSDRSSSRLHLGVSQQPQSEEKKSKDRKKSTGSLFGNETYTPATGAAVKKSSSAAPMLKVTPPTTETVVADASADSIPKWKSEPHDLFGTPEFSDEAPGSVHYITEDGGIDYSVILKAIHTLMMNSKEQDVGIQVLKVVGQLIQLYTLLEVDEPSTSTSKKFGFDDDTFLLFIDTVVNCIIALGCLTCTHLSTPISSSCRNQICMALLNLHRVCNQKFCKFFNKFAEDRPLSEICDFFHSYMGFCTHGNTQNLSDRLPFNTGPSGYATNFGHSITGEGHRGVEGIIVVQTLKTVVSRLSTILTDPTQSDNVLDPSNKRLELNARKFLNYACEVHGGTYRRVAFSGLLDSAKKLKEDAAKKAAAKLSCPTPPKEKKPTRRSSRQISRGENILARRKALSDTEIGDESETESKNQLMPSANTRTSKSDVEDIYTDDEELTKPKLSFHALSQATVAMVRARRKVKDHIKQMSSKQANKESPGIVHRAAELYSSNETPVETREKRLVDMYLIRSGMLRFNLLMNVSQPGSLPEPEFLAALLQLDAPVAARASLYLECAYFVNQCTQGNWPTWMQVDFTTGIKSAPQKRSVTMQRTAAGLFYRWAEAIGLKLKLLLDSEETDIFSVISESGKEGSELSIEEDYLDEATINPKEESKSCPHALKILASLLVYEITVFLREVYQHLPVIHSQHKGIWQSYRQGRRGSYVGGTGNPLKPSSPTPEKDLSGQRCQLYFRRSLGYVSHRHSHIGDSATSVRQQQQRISLMGGLEANSGAFGSTTSINSAVFDSGHRKASTGVPKSKKLSATPSSTSGTGVLMRNSRSIKLKPTGSRSAKSSVSSVPLSGEIDESSVLNSTSASFDPADMELYAELYDELHNKLNWLTSIIQLASVTNFICEHIGPCHKYCFRRQNKSCQLLLKALEKIYEVDVTKSDDEPVFAPIYPSTHNDSKRPSVTRLTKSSSQILLANVMDATLGKRRSLDRTMPFHDQETKKAAKPPPIMAYLKKHSSNLMSVPLSTIMKSAAVLKEEEMASAAAVAWEFLLEADKELVATAASVLLMVAGQIPQSVQDLMLSELNHALVENRISAIRKFYVLWTYRYQIWSRLEPGAQLWFKVMPPSIDYTLPSSPVGLPGQIVPDPPWMPLYKLKLEELAANQEGSKSLVTATNTRRKQQQEMVAKALVAEECRKREAREAFPLSSVAVSIQAAQEFTKTTQIESDEGDDVQEQQPVKEVITAHSVFPTCICLVGLTLFDKLEDGESYAGSTVGASAGSIIRRCMIEDPSLFFRYLFEKLTNPEKRSEMFVKLRKLLIWMPNLPSNTAYILFNNLVGYVLYYNRTANSNAQICMSQAMSLMAQLAPSVQGLHFKDLKTMLKKVQSEQTLMITAHLPSPKRVIIHGLDSEKTPPSLMVHEDTQFKHLLQESMEYFSITEELDHYQMANIKSSQLHSRHDFVRDFYVFRRDATPHLKLVKMDPRKSFEILQKQAIDMKFIEMCKVELAKNILKSTNKTHIENQVLFLHEEFSKQVAFPRKALETEFSYFVSTLGDEMYGTDVTHKLSWISFLETLFKSMPGTFGWTNELKLFLNVINGCLILNCTDHGVLRSCIAIYLNLANHFKQVFATDGFLLIMPTIIKVFNTHSNYPTLRAALLFLHSNLYKLHRRAYLLQFLGSYEPFLSACETKEEKLILAEQLFELLHSLESTQKDVLGVLDMVWNNDPIRTLDFCYDDNEEYTVLDALNTMITVVGYQTECHRSTQMLVVLEAIIPCYLAQIMKLACKSTPHGTSLTGAEEIVMYGRLSHSIKALIAGSEALMKPLTAQHRLLEGVTSLSGHKKDMEESVTSGRNIEEGRHEQEHDLELRTLRSDFRKPRDALLSIVSEYFSTCLSRLEVMKHSLDRVKITASYFLDNKSHERLGEVAHSLLKVGTYDSETMSCRGLQRYMQEILPEGDWSQESMKNAINIITKRLERIFVKVHKRSNVRALADWDALATLLRGICLTLESQPTLHHLAHVKSLVNSCILIVLEYSPAVESNMADRWNILPNHIFCSMVAKLAAQHAAILGETGGIEQMCGGTVPTAEKVEMMLANFVIPLCLRIGGNDREKHIIPQTDIRFILCLILSSLIPNSSCVDTLRPKHPEQFSIHTHHGLGHTAPRAAQPTSLLLQKLALLGLKTLLVCCDDQLYHILPILYTSVVEIGERLPSVETLKLFEFLVNVRTALYPLIRPYLFDKLLTKVMGTEEEMFVQRAIAESINSVPAPVHKTQLLAEFAKELDIHRSSHAASLGDMMRSASVSMGATKKRRFSTWRKSSLISKIHQNDHHLHATTERPATVVSASAVREPSHYHTTDETDSNDIEIKLTRSMTSKGSRYGNKNPLKRISAPEGARVILDKFKNMAYPHVGVSSSKQQYEQLSNAGRRPRASLHLIRQPHIIIEEETTSPSPPVLSSAPMTSPFTAGMVTSGTSSLNSGALAASSAPEASSIGAEAIEIKVPDIVLSGESGEPAPPIILDGYTKENVVVSQPEVRIMMPEANSSVTLQSADYQQAHVVQAMNDSDQYSDIDTTAIHGLHRQGALYEHGKEPRRSSTCRLSTSNEPTLLKSKGFKCNNASALQGITPTGTTTGTIATTTPFKKSQHKLEMVKPEEVVIDMTPMSSLLRTRESMGKLSSGSNISVRMLKRRGSDTEGLDGNEAELASSESCHGMGATFDSQTTTCTSAGSSPSMDNIPYIDNTSSSGEEV